MRYVLLSMLLALAPIVASADTTGALNGRVVDFMTQQPLANVEVRAVAPSADRMVHTNACGDFVMLNLPPDTYRVTFKMALYYLNGFSVLEISAGEETHVQVALKRQFWLIDGLRPRPIGVLVRPGVTGDIYNLNNNVPVMAPPVNAFSLLEFVPGITFGVAPRAIR